MKDGKSLLYARSDVMSVFVPLTSGGCSTTHTRPVNHGAPVKVWELDCPKCENHLRGADKPQVIKATHFNPTTGEPGQVQHVADSDPLWGSNPDTTPVTPDEKRTRSYNREMNEKRMHALEIATSFKNAGIDVTQDPEIMDFLRQNGVSDSFLQQLTVHKDDEPVPGSPKRTRKSTRFLWI